LSFGRVLVAATARGVCSVALGDSDAELSAALFAEYPNASIDSRDTVISPSLNLWLSRVLEHLSGKSPRIDLPLDIQATAFQWRVWEELQRIPWARRVLIKRLQSDRQTKSSARGS